MSGRAASKFLEVEWLPRRSWHKAFLHAGVVKLATTHDSKSCAERLEGSSPSSGTINPVGGRRANVFALRGQLQCL
jgi:hypothetical protein